MNVEMVAGDSLLRELDGLAHKDIFVGLQPLEIEVYFLNREGTSCQDSGKTGELTFDPCERNVARTP